MAEPKKTTRQKPDGTLVVSPLGHESYVPDEIVEALLESGYQKK